MEDHLKTGLNSIDIYRKITGRSNANLSLVSSAITRAETLKRQAQSLITGKREPLSAEDGKRISENLLKAAEQLESAINRAVSESQDQQLALNERVLTACHLTQQESYRVGFYQGKSVKELFELDCIIAYKLLATVKALGASAQQVGTAMEKVAPNEVAEIRGLDADIKEYRTALSLIQPLEAASSNFVPNPNVLAAIG